MNKPVNDQPVELTEEEAKQVSGGATAIVYGLIASGIAVTIITAAQALGAKLNTTFNNVSSNLK